MGPKTDKVSTFKLYVTNLPGSMTNEDVAKLFEPYGRVVESEVFRGNYAFVHMEDNENGKRAIEEMNGRELEEQVINVCQSKNLQGPKIATMKLAVRNIPTTCSAAQLRNLFVKYGYVLEAEVRGANGHVLLEATGDIRSAINEVSACEIGGNTLKVEAVTNYAQNAPTQSTPKSFNKLLGKRKEPAGPSGRNSGYGPVLPHPPPLAYPPYSPRRPGPGPAPPGPPRGRLMPPPCPGGPLRSRPMPPPCPGGPPRSRPMPPPMMRPYYAGRPPAYEDDFTESFPSYRNNRQDFSDDYEEPPPPFFQPGPAPPHRRPQPPQYYEDEPPYEPEPYGPRGQGPLPPPPVPLFSKPKRIARNRPPPFGPPRPLFEEPGPYPPDNNHEQDFYNDYEVYQPPPVRPTRPQRPPPPLLAPAPPLLPNPNVKTAKVTKFGKIVIEGSSSKGAKAADGAEKVKHRGVRGGVKVKARKAAIMAAMSGKKGQGKHLPSLLDAIPGTVRVVGEQRNPLGPPPLRGGPPRNLQAGPRPLMRPSSRAPVPLMSTPRNPPRQSGPKPHNNLLALHHHHSKRTTPVDQHHHQAMVVPAAAPIEPEIDFTADIELP